MELISIQNFYDYVFAQPYFDWLIIGIFNTLLITIFTTILSLFLGLSVFLFRVSKGKYRRFAGIIYINTFRNIPIVPFLLLLVIGLPGAFRSVTGVTLPRGLEFFFLIGVISLNTSTYISEIFRSAFRSVPDELSDCGRSLGMSWIQVKLYIVLPQIFRVSAPALLNRLIHNMKNSTIAFIIPLNLNLMEVLGQAKRIDAQTFCCLEPLLFASAVYLFLSLIMSCFLSSTGFCKQKLTREDK
jgi:polar amino acid transport system permease protein